MSAACPLCGDDRHGSCTFGAGSLGCVADPCTNPHHRVELVGARAPEAVRLADAARAAAPVRGAVVVPIVAPVRTYAAEPVRRGRRVAPVEVPADQGDLWDVAS